jgi:hypothetical protein
MQQAAVRAWLARILADAVQGTEAERLSERLAPQIEKALMASALDMLRQCSVAQFEDLDEVDAVREWTVSVNEAVAAAIRRLEHKRQNA